ncbi:MAG TPA: metallophosphoesterase [Blastocatellia bacterium]|nr:metallophosphoesterase [Blastocatellia bacterium]
MEDNKTGRPVTRRQVIASLATFTAGALFKPASVLSSPSNKTRFAVIGDFGTGGSDEFAVASLMYETHKSLALDFVLTAGDNIYPNGAGRYFQKNFEEPFAQLLNERVKFYATLGNHDVRAGRQDQIRYPLFNMNGSSYYSISRGNGLVDFFMLDSTEFDDTQTTWLENALRSSKALWKVAAFHHPLYSSSFKHGSDLKLRARVEPIFIDHGVQVVFSGHDHNYERTKPQNGIQYFVTGAGGKNRRGMVDKKSSIRAASFDEDNSFMLIELDEKEMIFKALSEKGETVDSGIIRQAP